MQGNQSVKEIEGLTTGVHMLRNAVFDSTHAFFKHWTTY